MKKLSKSLTLLVLIGLSSTVLAQKGNNNSQAGGLPALAEQLEGLQSLVASLQAQVDELSGGVSNPYAGDYLVFQFEGNQFGCGTTLEPLPGQFLPYIQTQGISSATAVAGVYSATSDGNTLTFSGADLTRNELRLSGKFETSTLSDESFAASVAADGSLSVDAESFIAGQMVGDGSSFVILAQGNELEGDGVCTDAWTILNIGVRI